MTSIANYPQSLSANSGALTSSTNHSLEQSALMYMTCWMTIGTIIGAFLGYNEFALAPGSSITAVTMISAVTGSVVGAAIGQLIGGFFHIIVNKSLDQQAEVQ